MVQTNFVSVILFSTALVSALPLQNLDGRSQELDTRSPTSFMSSIASITTRDLAELLALSERDLDEMEDLSVRDPHLKLSDLGRKVKEIAAASRRNRILGLLRPHRREEAGGVAGRDEAADVDDLISRDYDYELLD